MLKGKTGFQPKMVFSIETLVLNDNIGANRFIKEPFLINFKRNK